MAEDGVKSGGELSISAASSEAQKLLDKVFENLGRGTSGRGEGAGASPELFPNGVTNINVELALDLTSASPRFSVKLQISGPPDKAVSATREAVALPEPAARATPVRFRVRRHVKATPVLNNARTDRILRDGVELLRVVDGSDDVSCVVDLGRDGSVGTFSVGNGIISSEAEYNAVCGESAHPHRIYIVNQILFCGGSNPSPGFFFIGCADTPGECMILTRTDEDAEPVLWMHEFGHTRGLDHRNKKFAVMHPTIETDHRRVNAAERDAFQGAERVMNFAEEESPQPTGEPLNVRDFVHQKFIHGVPYEEARRYPPDVVPELLDMLSEPEEERYWPNIVATICMIGEPRAAPRLIQFIQEGEGELSRRAYDAKTVALMNLGYLIRESGVENAELAFQYLRAGLNPETWELQVKWQNPYNLSREEQNVQLAKSAVWGLALTGAPEAAEELRAFQQQAGLVGEEVADTSGVQPLNDLVEEALRYHHNISR